VTDWDNVKITAKKEVAWIRIDFDEDGHPMYMGERLVELRPGYWVHPWNWELQLRQLEEGEAS
jgi:hypothetical protein